jgi:CRP-like cAMP-binding protein
MWMGFLAPGAWISDYRAFLCRTKSFMNIEALEDAEVFQLGYEKMQKLYTYGPKFERLGRLIAEKLFIVISERTSSLILETPEERYRQLIRNQPHLLEMVPLRQIASYIGVRPESLSRIRKRISL